MFIKNSNLPEYADKLIIGGKYAGILDKSLKNLGLCPVYLPDNPYIGKSLSGHADLSVFYPGGENIFLAPYLKGSEFADKILKTGLKVNYCHFNQGKNYPDDAQLNMCAMADTLIYSGHTACQNVINLIAAHFKNLINIKQGYVRCSVCVVNDNSIITADRGVQKACSDAGLDVLLISPGYIDLPGYDYGFIGGSSFKISDKGLAFTGTLDVHPDKNRILKFLYEREIEPFFLTDRPIFDIGSAVPITEKARD